MPPPFAVTDEACAHFWDESAMIYPNHHSAVHKEECAYCCRTCKSDAGILVCMCCHTGLCAEHVPKHTSLHSNHAMYVWIRELPPKEQSEDTPKDVNMLGVLVPKEYESTVCCAVCRRSCVDVPQPAADFYQQIMHTASTGAKDSIEEDGGQYMRPQCSHLVCLEQLPNPFQVAPSSTDKCCLDGCECRINNWMCMTCGAIGCPRKEAGGSAHALQHYKSTTHPVVVKLGTVTPSGADFYCYECDNEVSDVHFAAHMLHFGIDIQTAEKTAKTLGEIQYDYSSQFDLKRITESGDFLVPVFGPGKTGIHNFGNSCYMSSVLQCFFSLECFREAFYHQGETRHQNTCRANPYNCHSCQLERAASGLLSGEFSLKDNERNNGIMLREFKQVFSRGHPEFSTAGQQDAQEYVLYLLEEMRRHVKLPNMAEAVSNFHPVNAFKMIMEQRIQCSSCRKVSYTHETDCCLSLPIPLEISAKKPEVNQSLTDEEVEASRPHVSLGACIASVMKQTDIECRCGACDNLVTYSKNTRIASFPDVLVIFLRRAQFDTEKMAVTKLDAFVDVPMQLDLESFRAKGLQPDEVEMPATKKNHLHKPVSTPVKVIDETALTTLLSMGIEESIARYALLQTGMNAERAIDYVFSREDIACEVAQDASNATETDEQDSQALGVARDGSAQYQLHAMISHMGKCAKAGHYVCHLRDEETGEWLLFNDEKVAVSQHPPFSMASTYFYKRCVK